MKYLRGSREMRPRETPLMLIRRVSLSLKRRNHLSKKYVYVCYAAVKCARTPCYCPDPPIPSTDYLCHFPPTVRLSQTQPSSGPALVTLLRAPDDSLWAAIQPYVSNRLALLVWISLDSED